MPQLLSDAATARTQSINLGTLEYAGELSKQLHTHAKGLEALFKTIQKALDRKASERELSKLLEEAKEKEAFGEKAKARLCDFN